MDYNERKKLAQELVRQDEYEEAFVEHCVKNSDMIFIENVGSSRIIGFENDGFGHSIIGIEISGFRFPIIGIEIDGWKNI